jgi:hypothetical protein
LETSRVEAQLRSWEGIARMGLRVEPCVAMPNV